jgi:hypothetical protein
MGLPPSLKHAFTPLLKKSSLPSEELSSYRPVATFPFLSKVVERIVAIQLTSFLEQNAIFDTRQSAYRSNHSCETAVLYVTDIIRCNMDKKLLTMAVFLDLSAAFDLVDHEILLKKLQRIGLRDDALNWIKVYLTERTYAVKIGQHLSLPRRLLCGVPQGSILGPILFSVYMLGIGSVLTGHNLQYVIYADDILVLVSSSVEELQNSATMLSQCVSNAAEWLLSHDLTLNKSKTECVLFGSAHLLSKTTMTHLHLDDHQIPISKTVRYLGVYLDNTLTLKYQIGKACGAAWGYMRVISRQRKALKGSALKMVLHSLVLSRVEYASSIYCGSCKSTMKPIKAISNGALRLLAGIGRRDSLSEARVRFDWLSYLPKTIGQICLCLIHCDENWDTGVLS